MTMHRTNDSIRATNPADNELGPEPQDEREEALAYLDRLSQCAESPQQWAQIRKLEAELLGTKPAGITTRWDPKPIPDRQFDWVATEDDYDMGRPVGYGRTEADAIRDLVDQLEERSDA